jgi:ring-1,2-phenylacetyl-CoA epoxidase subunit PaaC
MTPELTRALSVKLLALADDEYILGHRDSEWTGHAPILEEDIAFANIAQDEIGHAILWHNLLKDLTGGDPDQLVFFRDAAAYRNALICELPKGDWAFTMMRQYLFDAAEFARLTETVNSQYKSIAEVSAKIRPEEMYHYRHTSNWVKRLGQGTQESHRRMQAALGTLWPYGLQLFVPIPGEDELIAANIAPDPRKLRAAWEERVRPWLVGAGLAIPPIAGPAASSREQHTDHLTALLTEMQEVARLESPEVKW